MTNWPVTLELVTGSVPVDPIGPTIAHTLGGLRMPETMFQAYAVNGGELTPIPAWTAYDALRGSTDGVVIRALRNTLFDTILPLFQQAELQHGTGFEAIVPGDGGAATARRTVVTHVEAQKLIVDQVGAFVREHGTAARGCVFGVSGGGDSNALAFGLRRAVPADRLFAFTLTFRDVMTRAAADRATVLCQDLGIEHVVYEPDELARLLDMRTSVDALYEDFAGAFGHEAVHFFGTFLILKTARVLGQRRGFGDLAFGYNREDLLAELLFMVMNGQTPLAYPLRPLGEQRIVMPVWRAPKLLLDACHPVFSLENYRERDAHTTRQRSLAFYLAHSLDSAYPSFGLSVLEGMRKLFDGRFAELEYDADLDVYVTALATPERRGVVREMLNRHFA
ncbi:hypothetical protein ACQP00_18165 [Dactylosporangium sp. CS-047395]|uniref:hypothetical protein n=1 Tax=Dactylosporangium sp. CS-047395 TaxID=3239936 RepID=UPI003D947D53